jgi:general secretion pathway protein K
MNMTWRNQCGAALIMALLVVALAATLSGMMLWRQDVWLRQVEMQRDLAQARLIADAGIEWASAVLAYDMRTSGFDHNGEAWAVKVPPTRVEGGEIGGEVTDEQGKWNLNNLLAADGSVNLANQEIFRRLLQLLQLPASLAATLGDWLDADSDAAPDGAEDAYYLELKPPYRAANRALSDVDDLLRVRGFDARTVEQLRPHVTALPGYHRVNVNTVSAMVLGALVPELSPAEARNMLAQRDRIPFKDVNEFKSRLPRPEIAAGADQLDTRSRYFRVQLRAGYGRAALTTEALLERQGVDWPSVLWQKYQ